jgi:hypothetical protein
MGTHTLKLKYILNLHTTIVLWILDYTTTSIKPQIILKQVAYSPYLLSLECTPLVVKYDYMTTTLQYYKKVERCFESMQS